MVKIKKLFLIFLIAFILNLVWENLHSFLYEHYMGGEITELILIKATFVDALIIIILSLPFVSFSSIEKYDWLIVPLGFLVSLLIEWWALSMGRWAYNMYMPIIPFLETGITPSIQLGLLGYGSLKIQSCALKQFYLI